MSNKDKFDGFGYEKQEVADKVVIASETREIELPKEESNIRIVYVGINPYRHKTYGILSQGEERQVTASDAVVLTSIKQDGKQVFFTL